MQKTLIRPIVAINLMLILAFGFALITSSFNDVGAQATDQACQGVALTGGSCDANAEGSLGTVVSTIVNILSIIVGAVSVIMIIIGGLRYITSGGDAQKTAGAKNTILYAVVGLVIVIFAQVIVAYVLNNVGGGGTEEEGLVPSSVLDRLA